MRIRTITCFIDPKWPLDKGRLQAAAEFLSAAKETLISAGEEVQTTRLATIPFPDLLPDLEQSRVVELAVALENQTLHSGVEYISIGPAQPDRLESYAAIPHVIKATKNVFVSGSLTTPAGEHLAASGAPVCGGDPTGLPNQPRRLRQPALCGTGKRPPWRTFPASRLCRRRTTCLRPRTGGGRSGGSGSFDRRQHPRGAQLPGRSDRAACQPADKELPGTRAQVWFFL